MVEHGEAAHTILVVEDEDEPRELLRVGLENEGFQVLTANDGAEAVRTAHAQKPDVILMDIQLPVKSGVEATRELKDHDATRRIPVIMITVLEEKRDVIEGFEAGAYDYITKPFFLPELKARIKSVLRFKKIHDDLWAVREQVIKEQMLNTLYEVVRTIQDTIDDNLAFINNIADNVHQKCGNVVNEDLDGMKDAANNIRNTVKNLTSLDSLVFKVYQNITEIIESTS
jgi:DNA-binding response OmpR family regulator